MKAILIDPKLHRVVDIELAGDSEAAQLEDMRRVIGAASLGHSRISDVGDSIWCDDTILARGEPCWGFRLGRRDNFLLLAGNCVVVGADRHGNSREPQVPLAMLANDCEWLDEIVPQVDWVQEQRVFEGRMLDGFIAVITYSRPQ